MSNTLANELVKESFGRVVQIVSGSFYDGFGNPITIPSASFAVSSSHALGGSGSFSGSFSASYVDMDTSWDGAGFPTWREGRVFYDASNDALAYYNSIAAMTVQVGQETIVRVRNATGVPITDGSPVRIEGAQGNRPKIVLADSHIHEPSDVSHHGEILGLTTHTINHNDDGFVTVRGMVRGIDTSDWGEGDILYVSSSAGELTNIKPPPPYDAIAVGVVAVAGNNGEIYVDPRRPTHFHDISSVSMSVWPNDKDVLVFNSSSRTWTAQSLGSQFRSAYRIVSSSYTVQLSDGIIEVITPNVTASLPTAIGNVGKEYSIINATTESIMVLASGSQTIGNHPTTNDSYLLVLPENAPRIVSNNSRWRLV